MSNCLVSLPQSDLSASQIKNLIEHLRLKKWWVAEMVGIHRTTLQRFLKGSTKKLNSKHYRQLMYLIEAEIKAVS